jgi:hypothetical protein
MGPSPDGRRRGALSGDSARPGRDSRADDMGSRAGRTLSEGQIASLRTILPSVVGRSAHRVMVGGRPGEVGTPDAPAARPR